MQFPDRPVGEWARVYDQPQRLNHRDPRRIFLEPAQQHQFEAGYYGSINHIDDQIDRILMALPRPENTLILFTADHGEMLGDHQWIRKTLPYEGSARIPFILRPPESWTVDRGEVSRIPVQLADIMPTFLAAAGIPIPESVDGHDLKAALEGRAEPRPYVHGECAEVATLDSGMQYLTDGREKYIWFPGRGEEQFFDLEEDPQELHDLAGDPACRERLTPWRQRLVSQLQDRPEGFVREGALAHLDGPTAFHIFDTAAPPL